MCISEVQKSWEMGLLSCLGDHVDHRKFTGEALSIRDTKTKSSISNQGFFKERDAASSFDNWKF